MDTTSKTTPKPALARHDDRFAQQLLEGSVDFIEAGDCRRPGQADALRAVATGSADFPLAIGAANKDSTLDQMQKTTLAQGMDMLRDHARKLAVATGPAARVFTVKLRKNYSI